MALVSFGRLARSVFNLSVQMRRVADALERISPPPNPVESKPGGTVTRASNERVRLKQELVRVSHEQGLTRDEINHRVEVVMHPERRSIP